jgi:tetratricopeptide (TPR) repeat protein
MRTLLFFLLFLPLFSIAQPASTGTINADSVKNVNIIKYYTMQIAENPKDASFYYKRGDAKLNLNYYKEAILDFNQCILLDPQYEEAYIDRGRSKDDLGD